MKHTTTLIAALSGLTLLAGLPTSAMASFSPEKSKTADKETLADLVDMKKPELWIGSSAPELSIAKFVKGDSVDGFEEGQVYVVEFWATWCGPCIAAFPHLSELQAHYGDDVRFIGVNVWEREQGQERMDLVEEFVAKQGDRMSYTVAVEDGSSMADNWMKPAGQGGIPAAFIVDGNSKIAWIGHPGTMDEPLKAIVSGEYDGAADAAKSWNQQITMAALQSMDGSFRTGEKLDKARKIGKALADKDFGAEPWMLNAVAWIMLSSEAEGVGMEDYKFALATIATACEQTEWKDWGMLDSYALGMHKTGDTTSAIKWQKKAIELAMNEEEGVDKKVIKELTDRLAEYEED